MTTPVRGLRRVPFFPHEDGTRSTGLQPSPYTPISIRRPVVQSTAKTAPSRSPQTVPSRTDTKDGGDSAILSFPRPESADAFARGGAAEAALRSSCLDIVSAVGDDGLGLAQEIISALEVQLSFAAEFYADRSAHAFVRKEVDRVAETLRIERDTWTLVELAWRSDDMRCRDLCSRRASVSFIDDHSQNMPGMNVCRRILEWLEMTASQALDASGGPQLMPLEDPAYQWKYTANRMGCALNVDYPILSENESRLDEVESKAEIRLSREIYRLVRAGRIEETEMICRCVGQPWRAAILAGGREASALSALGVKGGAREVWRSAAQAIAMSSSSAVPSWERAVCGVLSGIMEPALAVAETYEDQLWARLSVLVDRAIERSLTHPRSADRDEKCIGQKDDITMSVDFRGSDANDGSSGPDQTDPRAGEPQTLQRHFADIDAEQILEAFRECTKAGEGFDGASPFVLTEIRIVRAYLALGPTMGEDNARELYSALGKLAQEGLDNDIEWLCRFSAHLALFVKKAGLLNRSDDQAVASYETAVLSHARLAIDRELAEEVTAHNSKIPPPVRPLLYDLVARYLAELESVDVLIDVYTQVMSLALRGDLKQERLKCVRTQGLQRQIHERRLLCLQRAGKCFGGLGRQTLDRMVVSAVDRIWADHLSHTRVSMEDDMLEDSQASLKSLVDNTDISQDDELVLRSVEFLMFPGFGNYEEALRRATCLARRFFLAGKYSSARYVVEWFPSDAIAEVAPGRCESELHELDCWRAYMDGVSRHNEWRIHYFTQRPRPLTENTRKEATAVPGDVTYETQASANLQMETYVSEMEAYMRVSAASRDAAIEALRVALLFEGGWMRYSGTHTPDSEPDAQRNREVSAVRRIGVPQLTSLLHHVLHESGLYAEAVELASLIADDGICLYEDFSKAELGALLQRVNLSMVFMADKSVKDGTAVRPYTNFIFEEVQSEDEQASN